MVKMISFPKGDYDQYLKAIDLYDNEYYTESLELFDHLYQKNHFKKLVIKYLLDIHILLERFTKVYDLIEEAFLDGQVEEDYLIERYIYAMILDQKYQNALKFIELLLCCDDISVELKQELNRQKKLAEELMMKHHLFNEGSLSEIRRHSEMVNLIVNLEQLNYSRDKVKVIGILTDQKADPLIKYQLIKYLASNGLERIVPYTNSYGEQFDFDLYQFVDIYDEEVYLIPPRIVYDNICKYDREFIINLELIQSIWLNDYLKIYPKQTDDIQLLAYILHQKINQLFKEYQAKIDLESLYERNQDYIIDKFNSKHFTNYQFML